MEIIYGINTWKYMDMILPLHCKTHFFWCLIYNFPQFVIKDDLNFYIKQWNLHFLVPMIFLFIAEKFLQYPSWNPH